jgi:hypothetical protein
LRIEGRVLEASWLNAPGRSDNATPFGALTQRQIAQATDPTMSVAAAPSTAAKSLDLIRLLLAREMRDSGFITSRAMGR